MFYFIRLFFSDTTLLEDPILKLLQVIFHAVDKHGSIYDEIILIEKALKMDANLSPRVTQVPRQKPEERNMLGRCLVQ